MDFSTTEIWLAVICSGLLLALFLVLFRHIRQGEIAATLANERNIVYEFINRFSHCDLSHLNSTLEIILGFIMRYTQAEAGAIFLINEDDETISPNVVMGNFPPFYKIDGLEDSNEEEIRARVMQEKIPIGKTMLGLVAKGGETIYIHDTAFDPRIPRFSNPRLGVRSCIVAPLIIQENLIGVLAVINKEKGAHFSTTDRDLVKVLADQAAVMVNIVQVYRESQRRHRVEQEVELAQEFQELLLPRVCPRLAGYDIAGINQPAHEMGGDYYDYIPLSPTRLGVAIADVSGKGIPAAMVMTITRSTLINQATPDRNPAEVLSRINQRLYTDTKPVVFISMIYGILDSETRTFTFARAGHEPLVFMNEKREGYQIREPNGMVLGISDGGSFKLQEETLNLEDGDLLVLYTDGVIEMVNEQEVEYGRERFLHNLLKAKDRSSKSIIDYVMDDIQCFKNEASPHDDLTMIVIKANSRQDEGDELLEGDIAVSKR